MCIKLYFVQLYQIWVKSDNLDFSLFHGVPPLDFLWVTHKMSVPKNPKICKGGTPWKSEKSRLSDWAQILHSCAKCNFMHIAKITATFLPENFSTCTNNPTGDIWAVSFCNCIAFKYLQCMEVADDTCKTIPRLICQHFPPRFFHHHCHFFKNWGKERFSKCNA